MTTRNITIGEALDGYLTAHSPALDPVAADLITETQEKLGRRAGMQISPVQAAFTTLLTKIVGVRHAVEVGTFTGYSSLSIARGMLDGGKLICCDVSEEWTSMARRYWDRAGVSDRIELRIAPAAETLKALPAEPYLDLSFIDADKTGYPTYWAELVPRTRPGGVILVDNTLWSGHVVDPAPDDTDARAISEFNELVRADTRVESAILPIGDGVTLARKL